MYYSAIACMCSTTTPARFKNSIPDRLNMYLDQLPEDWDIVYDSDWITYQEIFEGNVTPEKLVYKNMSQKSKPGQGSPFELKI